jgi:hypothetical protein
MRFPVAFSIRVLFSPCLVALIALASAQSECDPDDTNDNETSAPVGATETHSHSVDDDCASCHVFDLTLPTIKEIRETECDSCHSASQIRGAVIDWTHETRDAMLVGTTCFDCHAVGEKGGVSLLSKGNDLCLSCHAKIEKELRLASSHPIAEGVVECLDCHPAHRNQRLPLTFDDVEYLGAFAYGSHDPMKQNAGCLSCHSYFRLTSIQGSEFVIANTMNLHETHCERAFAACIECHNPHGSFAPMLMVDKVGAANYLTFVRGDGWGTCSVICHSEPHMQTAYGADPEMLISR